MAFRADGLLDGYTPGQALALEGYLALVNTAESILECMFSLCIAYDTSVT